MKMRDFVTNAFIAYFIGALWIFMFAIYIVEPLRITFITSFASPHHNISINSLFSNIFVVTQYMVLTLMLNYLKLQQWNKQLKTNQISAAKAQEIKNSISYINPDIIKYITGIPFQFIYLIILICYFTNIRITETYSYSIFSYLQIILALFFNETGDYWIHRIFHLNSLYKYHKQHHQYIEVIAGGVSRGSVFGKLLLVLPATLLNPCVYGMHISLFISFISWIQWHSILEHSGFDWLPFTLWNSLGWIDSEFYNQHEFHHNRNNGCFSGYSPGFWDYICQTDKKYIELKNKNKLSALPSITTTVKTYADLLTFLITIVE
eukprot:160260_1